MKFSLTICRLCHNVHGPHDDVFQKLWNQLRDELEALIRKGYTGEGFLGKGHKLGGSSRIPMDEARRQARAAAERRKTLNAGSGQKVGGRTVRRGEDIRRVIADAAQQRFNITKGCARDNDKQDQIIEEVNRNGFRTQAEEDDANEQAIMQAYMELVQEDEREKYGKDYVAPSRENPTGALGGITPESSRKPTTMRPPPVPSATKPKEKPKEKASEKPEVRREPKPKPQIIPETIPSVDDVWTCEICTLNNQATYLCCEACLTERPEIYIPETRPTVQPSTSSRASNIQSGRSKPTQDQSANTNLRRKESRSNLDKFAEIERNKPLGWTCHRCSTFMEHQWWTCSRCGTMRLSS